MRDADFMEFLTKIKEYCDGRYCTHGCCKFYNDRHPYEKCPWRLLASKLYESPPDEWDLDKIGDIVYERE